MKILIKKWSISIFIITLWGSSIVAYAEESDELNVWPTYSLQEVNEGKLGDKITFNSIVIKDSDYEWYKNTHDGKSIPEGTITNETNFVGARENTGINAGVKNVWDDEIIVEDGKSYIVRLYVHNNGPSGEKGVSKGTQVRFYIPYGSSGETTINGWLSASNATPTEYLDNVTFKSPDETPFHLEYVKGSACLENGGIGSGEGIILSDSITNQGNPTEDTDDEWTKIGYNALDGNVPGGYEYTNYVSIEVKAIFDYDFTTETKVRLANSEDKTWQDSIEAKIGDKVEILIGYRNTSDQVQKNATIRTILPSNLCYISNSTILRNSNYPDNATILDYEPSIITETINIGSYGPNANAYIMFTAEVVDVDLAEGVNTLVNWGQAGVSDKVVQDYATVEVYKTPENHTTIISILCAIIIFCFVAIIFLVYKIAQKRRKLGLPKHKWRNKK